MIVNAERWDLSNSFDGPIYFDQIYVNEGNAMTYTKFTSTRHGMYRFSLSANTAAYALYVNPAITTIEVWKGNSRVLDIIDGEKRYAKNNIKYTWMMILERGDQISFYVRTNFLRSSWMFPVTFTAVLIAE